MKKVGTPKGRPTVVRGKTVKGRPTVGGSSPKVRPSGDCSTCK